MILIAPYIFHRLIHTLLFASLTAYVFSLSHPFRCESDSSSTKASELTSWQRFFLQRLSSLNHSSGSLHVSDINVYVYHGEFSWTCVSALCGCVPDTCPSKNRNFVKISLQIRSPVINCSSPPVNDSASLSMLYVVERVYVYVCVCVLGSKLGYGWFIIFYPYWTQHNYIYAGICDTLNLFVITIRLTWITTQLRSMNHMQVDPVCTSMGNDVSK